MDQNRIAELEAIKALLDHMQLLVDRSTDSTRVQEAVAGTLSLHGAMLRQILQQVMQDPAQEETPLEKLLRELVEIGHEHAATLRRLEGHIAKLNPTPA